ncbi:YajG family lipoprotein [Colwelliaceae bacterium 6441]
MNIYLKTALIPLAFTLLSSCSSAPKQMVVSPQVIGMTSNAYLQKTANVIVNDLRTNSHIIAIHKEGDAIELISANTLLDETIKSTYINLLNKQSLSINNNSANIITLTINQADIKVSQELVKYKTKSLITLTAKVTSGEKTLTKTYKNNGKSEGVFTADLAVLERNFNQQLGKVLTQIVNDKEIQLFIN